jgi:hypothetical protein
LKTMNHQTGFWEGRDVEILVDPSLVWSDRIPESFASVSAVVLQGFPDEKKENLTLNSRVNNKNNTATILRYVEEVINLWFL